MCVAYICGRTVATCFMHQYTFLLRMQLFPISLYIDIDECATGAHNCKSNERCINRPGKFSCKCAGGYKLVNDTCKGIYGLHNIVIIQ